MTLEVRGLSKQFAGASAPALRELSFSLRDGEVLTVVGPSGCGKSTLLRLIAGLDDASSGQVLVAGKNVSELPPQDRDIAMVFQGYALYPHMTVRNNIDFPLKMRGLSKKERDARVAEKASLLRLNSLLDRFPGELSGGERQRVAIGRALVRDPKVFLFDEPLANLDAALRTELRRELRTLFDQIRTTSLYVTHDQSEAMTLGHRVMVLNAGALEQIGLPEEVYNNPASPFVAEFLGSAPMHWLSFERTADTLRCGPLAFSVAGKFPKRVRAAVRAERTSCTPSVGAQPLPGRVLSAEALGEVTLVTVSTAAGTVCVKVPGFYRNDKAEALVVHISPERLFWFDAENNERLPWPEHPAP